VLELLPNGALVRALIRDSGNWPRIAVEGDMLFPDRGQSYLGFLWGHQVRDSRSSYGNIYLKGNDSYSQVNPHWDHNPVREMYPEYSAMLQGADRIRIGEWHRFRIELVDGAVHFYAGSSTTPRLTFDQFGAQRGDIGFRPRVVGSRVWIDNIRVTAIERFSAPAARPPIETARHKLITAWEVFGPLAQADETLELGRAHEAKSPDWNPFPTDPRGAVVAARIIDYLGPRAIAYFRSRIHSDSARTVTLRLASLNHAAVWLNGRFLGHANPVTTAWYDIAADSTRPHINAPLRLQAGENILVLRLRGGQYASGGFYAALLE
jgi:hypothetical protein